MQDWKVIILAINTILCFCILILSINYSQKSGNRLSLYIGIAFGLFGITHLIMLLEADREHGPVIVGIRLFAYSFVVLALIKFLKNTQKHKLVLAEKERFKLLFTTSPDSVSISSFDSGTILDINDTFTTILGYTMNDVIGKSSRQLNLWKDDNQRRLLTDMLIENEYCPNYEAEFIKKDGNTITVIISARKITIDDTDCIISVIKDISDRKRYEEKLKELNSTKDKFFAILAHDLKNPLGSFYGVAELLVDEYEAISEIDRIKYLQIIRESAGQLYSLLENLLEWSRSQRGLITLTNVEINMRMLANNSKQVLQLAADKKDIKIRNMIPDNISVYADANLANTIIRNLVSNAIKFTDLNGEIEIGFGAESEANYHTFYVRDTGIGIKDDIMSKLFQIDKSITSKGTKGETGTGLGLILCKEFVEKHNGKIWVESELDKGTTFYFTLPTSKTDNK